MAEPTSMAALLVRLTGRALFSPRVAVDLLALTWAFRRQAWWRRPPFLPLPDPVYLAWRLHTAYGDQEHLPPVEDVIRFARWRRKLLHD